MQTNDVSKLKNSVETQIDSLERQLLHCFLQVEAGMFVTSTEQTIRKVPMFRAAICHVRHGKKSFLWNEKKYEADHKKLALFPAGQELEIVNSPGVMGYKADMLCFSPSYIDSFRRRYADIIAKYPYEKKSNNLCIDAVPLLLDKFDNCIKAIHENTNPSLLQHTADGLLLALVVLGEISPLLFNRNDLIKLRVEQLLLSQPGANWRFKYVADYCNMSESTLRRHLKNEGTSFLEILDSVRLSAALFMLQTSKKQIGIIANNVGYQSTSRFSLKFKSRFGLSPKEIISSKMPINTI